MKPIPIHALSRVALVAGVLGLATATAALAHEAFQHSSGPAKTPAEAAFLAENDLAMTRMMSAMTVEPTGDIDRDFVEMMVPHHQGAIDMALAVLRHGKNEQLKRLAQEIIVTQQQEIVAMRLAIGDPLPPAQPAPTQVGDHSAHSAGHP
ncbi:DUF305 domain-containing protein [Pseudomonas sp. AA-38]|uniref:DUF305 domain-containing protein n=1 Tax=Pseudomonas sp. AA-38 TaxID=3028807 RepID=UPI0023F6F1C0|nr:DUF305 domain-containing protein [Pseudomonas sp. AA-38]